MISLQWQDGVLSLLDQAAYPQQEPVSYTHLDVYKRQVL